MDKIERIVLMLASVITLLFGHFIGDVGQYITVYGILTWWVIGFTGVVFWWTRRYDLTLDTLIFLGGLCSFLGMLAWVVFPLIFLLEENNPIIIKKSS